MSINPELQTWCAALLALHSTADGTLCDTVFNASVLARAESIPRGEVLSHLGWDRAGRPTFVSGAGQDWWAYHNYARWATPGLFVDLATNDPIIRSNSYFLEQCMGWKGVCIEPLPSLHSRIRAERSCELVPRCIAAQPGPVTFWSAAGNTGGASKVMDPHSAPPPPPLPSAANKSAVAKKAPRLTGSSLVIECERLQDVLDRSEAFRAAGGHVQLLSLDVEGHEMPALSSVDWSRTTIDIIITEGGKTKADQLALKHHLTTELGLYQQVLHTGISDDSVFVRRGFAFGPKAPGRRGFAFGQTPAVAGGKAAPEVGGRVHSKAVDGSSRPEEAGGPTCTAHAKTPPCTQLTTACGKGLCKKGPTLYVNCTAPTATSPTAASTDAAKAPGGMRHAHPPQHAQRGLAAKEAGAHPLHTSLVVAPSDPPDACKLAEGGAAGSAAACLLSLARRLLTREDRASFLRAVGVSADVLLDDVAQQMHGELPATDVARLSKALLSKAYVVAHPLNAQGLHPLRALLAERLADRLRRRDNWEQRPEYADFYR